MVSKVIRHNGILKIDIDGKLYSPLSFKSFRPNPKNVSEFYGAGIRLFSVLSSGIISATGVPYSLYGESWIGEGEYDFSKIDNQMDMFIENAPDAYFAPMLQLDTRGWYLEKHPEVPNSFTHLSQIACDETWKKAAADYMKAAIEHIEEKYGDRVYGYFLLGGTTTEWFSDRDYEASHPIKENGFKKWCNDENAALPSLDRFNMRGETFLTESENDVYKARKFHSDTIADLILYFTGEAQSILKHKKLLGLYYGYLFELGGERLYNAGSLGYEKVFLSDDIDMISSPSAYEYRGQKDPSAFMLTKETLDAHNKLYFLEFDHITHVAPEEVNEPCEKDDQNRLIVKIPGFANKCKNETESLNLMYRDFVLCNANSAALWWFDMFDGWFRSEKMMEAVKHMVQINKYLSQFETTSVAEIAVFAEGESMYRTRKTERLATLSLSHIRRTLAECGAAYDLYSISDLNLDKVNDYKLYVFVNQYDITEENKRIITEKCKKAGKTILWIYAPDYAQDGKTNVKNICDVTGINAVKSKESHGGIVYNGKITNYEVAAPYFSIEDADAKPLSYFEDGAVAVAYKETDEARSVYASTVNIPSSLLREIARLSGVHIYSESGNVYAYPNSTVIGVFNATDEDAQINLTEDGKYEDLIEGLTYESKDKTLVLPKKDINAYLLRRK